MKIPHALSNAWTTKTNEDSVPITMPATNKKVKRKSQEPKKMRAYADDMFDVDAVDEIQPDECKTTGPALLPRQLMTSQDTMASAAEMMSGLTEEKQAAQSSAIDMTVGTKVPAVPSELSQLPASPSFHHHSWSQAISQPLSNRLAHDLCSTLSPPISTSSRQNHSPSHLAFSLEPSVSGQTAPLHVTSTSHTFLLNQCMEPQVQLPKESPRKRIGMTDDEPGRLPEVKAIQQTRRLLANARERTRVHTISAAFEALRKQVPCYSYGQKLSKLAILRIACNYILSLAQLAELDYSSDHSSLSFSQCVEQCTRTLQAEGRSKKRKE